MAAVAETPTPAIGCQARARQLIADQLGGTVLARPGMSAPPHAAISAHATILERTSTGSSSHYRRWLDHVTPVGECTHPVRLAGALHTVNASTGEVVASGSTSDLPDGVLYKACGNRRASVCPSCAETYRADTYQLIHAGIAGGKSVPATVRAHPFAFLTLTAPSFGLVHTTRARNGRPRPCRPRRTPQVCPHGVQLACQQVHQTGDPQLGLPLCLDCYHHAHQVVWNVMAGELWRRTTATLAKHLARLPGGGARLSFGKVAEMQARGVVHFHAILRLDALAPNRTVTAAGDVIDVPGPPPPAATLELLAELLRVVVAKTRFSTLPHPDRPGGWLIGWGAQVDIRPVPPLVRQEIGPGPIAETAVAGYLAKYATKATEAAGHVSARLTPETISAYAEQDSHVGRLIDACWHLGRPGADLDPFEAAKNSGRLSYTRLRRWAHMLGFGGHFSTKSRRYSVTLGSLRQARIDWRRAHAVEGHRLADELDGEQTTLLVGTLTFAGTGWHTTGDALLARTAAAQARERHRAGRDELAYLDGRTANRPSIAA